MRQTKRGQLVKRKKPLLEIVTAQRRTIKAAAHAAARLVKTIKRIKEDKVAGGEDDRLGNCGYIFYVTVFINNNNRTNCRLNHRGKLI